MDSPYKTSSPDRYSLLEEKAKEMRRRPTEAETLLWNYLKGNQLGVKFRRQHVINDYIADFACLSHKLVIELDGSVHSSQEQQEHDLLKDKCLSEMGYFVMRFTNRKLFSDIDGVLDIISKYINDK